VSCELEIKDLFGRRVLLDHSNWVKHAPRRPEVVPYHDRISLALTDPDWVLQTPDGQRHFYRRDIGEGRFRNHYLRVIVEYYEDRQVGKIKTCWFQRTIDTVGAVLWMHPTRSV
jgi:hypothetical protein